MRILVVAVVLLCCAAVHAHTPVCRCELNGNRIECEGRYDDGSSGASVTMRVVAYGGETLVTGKLDEASRFSTTLPTEAFYILMDVGPGEVFEVDWRDIEGIDRIDRDSFTTTETEDVVDEKMH